ncbi:hypothetical protein KFL_006200080 [Klebsormidium nitens]|uniref:C2H2-type domain-containing protein n=1 Tax=Klebsormidium nitens TaxID=105231 RepID=A0A1Y1IQ52_KLENI|nr:hypothetical protein KFL_006200080 [Klebsormidium nitens]|eukprot:GAQ90268.1 hypothetical protein KFL_006200080 [Klebsormidium nitens]
MTHSGERPYACTVCDVTFSQKGTRDRHERTHTGERPYTCTECDATFAQGGDLRRHNMTHTGERPYACTECDATFARGGALRRHNRTHTGERPYVCTQCDATFAHGEGLWSHQRMHSGKRPYACIECDAKFARGSDLRSHQRTHTGERPYACTECDATFAQGGGLQIHRRTHTGERPYACIECGAAFVTSDNQKKHFRDYHTAEGQQRRKREEERVAKLLEGASIDFKREHAVSFRCILDTFARVDFIIILNGKVIVLEVDEYQHDGYGVACDVSRMIKLYGAWLLEGNTLPVRFLRYNPHLFRVDGKQKKLKRVVREDRLLRAIREASEAEGDGMRVWYLYYDVVAGKPAIMQDPAFTIEHLATAQIDQRYGPRTTAPYALKIKQNHFVDAACKRGIGSIANAPRGTNKKTTAEYAINNVTSTMRLKATRPIYNGQEILVGYGSGYWAGHKGSHRTRRR